MTMNRSRSAFRALAPALLLMLLHTGCSTTDAVTGERVSNLWSIDDDIRLGSDMFDDLRREAGKGKQALKNDDAERIRKQVSRIAAVSHLPELPYDVLVLRTNVANAMALPGGKVVVFEGLYKGPDALVRSDDEMAAVLAHEIAHVNCRHSTERMTQTLPWQLLAAGGMIYAQHRGEDDLQTILGGGFLLYQGLIVTYYSREDEREADRVGLQYMARAGYNPQAAVDLWRRAAGRRDASPISLFSTHPPAGERAAYLEEALPEALALYEQARSADAAHSPKAPFRGRDKPPLKPPFRGVGDVQQSWR